MKKILSLTFTSIFFLGLWSPVLLTAQEALKSVEEEYYDFLSLQGITSRPTLGYRTLSDSEWDFLPVTKLLENEDGSFTKVISPGLESQENVWKNNNLGTTFKLWEASSQSQGGNWFSRGFYQGIKLKIYGPEWFNSYNTSSPYGQNDGALWQGVGYNTSLTGGARLEAYGLELTFKPQITFSQNKDFEFLPGVYGSPYSYFWAGNIDLVQRFGDKAYWQYDWGDSEIRYTFHNFTLGFGTQSPWLGPAQLNPMLGSNNAGTYPKFDFGFRKTDLIIPGLNWNLGQFEARVWIGQLTESDYFDDDGNLDKNQLTGFNLSYAPSFIPGFTVGATKICLTRWGNDFWKYINPFYSNNDVYGVGEDQKASFYIDYMIEKVGLELYSEIGLDDYLQGGFIYGLTRYPFDTLIWTGGLKKTFTISEKKSVYGQVTLEISSMELPRNKGKTGRYAFNFHHQIKQGYTNRGQCIGTALANGGNSQVLITKIYYPKGNSSLTIGRNNPDNTYSYNTLTNYNNTYKANFIAGLDTNYFVTKDFIINAEILYNVIINSMYWEKDEDEKISGTDDIVNFHFSLGLKWNL